jgi:sorbitol-specific phosphotransferase system component IIA
MRLLCVIVAQVHDMLAVESVFDELLRVENIDHLICVRLVGSRKDYNLVEFGHLSQEFVTVGPRVEFNFWQKTL